MSWRFSDDSDRRFRDRWNRSLMVRITVSIWNDLGTWIATNRSRLARQYREQSQSTFCGLIASSIYPNFNNYNINRDISLFLSPSSPFSLCSSSSSSFCRANIFHWHVFCLILVSISSLDIFDIFDIFDNYLTEFFRSLLKVWQHSLPLSSGKWTTDDTIDMAKQDTRSWVRRKGGNLFPKLFEFVIFLPE